MFLNRVPQKTWDLCFLPHSLGTPFGQGIPENQILIHNSKTLSLDLHWSSFLGTALVLSIQKPILTIRKKSKIYIELSFQPRQLSRQLTIYHREFSIITFQIPTLKETWIFHGQKQAAWKVNTKYLHRWNPEEGYTGAKEDIKSGNVTLCLRNQIIGSK